MMRFAWIMTAAAIVAMTAFSLYGLAVIPEDAVIARHWNLAGEVDGYSPRNHVLVFFPVLALVISAVFAAIPHIDPRKEHIAASRGLLTASWVGVLALFVALHGAIILGAARGETSAALAPGATLYGAALLIAVIGNFIAKSRSNFFLGVRTPWTLSSEHAWMVANRAAGWMFVATGAGAVAVGLIEDSRTGFIILLAGVLATAIISVALSYLAWRSDPERERA